MLSARTSHGRKLVADGPQHPESSVFVARPDVIGGHATEPYEQNTQQSPDLGRSMV